METSRTDPGNPAPPQGPPRMGILEKPKVKAAPKQAPAVAAAPPAPVVAAAMPWRALLTAACLLAFAAAFAVAFFSGPSDETPPAGKVKSSEPIVLAATDEAPRTDRSAEAPTKSPTPVSKIVETPPAPKKTAEPEKKAEHLKPEVKPEIKEEKKPAVVVVPGPPAVPGLEPEKIDAAVARGVNYLKASQLPTGSWSRGGHSAGYAALGGLTLLECKLSPKDPSVQKAAAFVRSQVPKMDQTYELGLSILFLDRLGDPRDKVWIQGMALRLVAGQNDRGGWDYRCPLLTPQDMHQLITYLKKTQPKVALQDPRKFDGFKDPLDALTDLRFFDPLEVGGDTTFLDPLDDPLGIQKGKAEQKRKLVQKALNPFQHPLEYPYAPLGTGKENPPTSGKVDESVEPWPPEKDAGPMKIGDPLAKDPLAKDTPTPGLVPKIPPKASKDKGPAARPEFLPPALRDIPAVVAKGKGKGKDAALRKGRDDNSNSQFALLGLWAARRHGLPAEFTLQLAGQRYIESQNPDGGWGYQVGRESSAAMSCVGLIGLAMGIGTAPALPKTKELPKDDPLSGKPVLDDAHVDRGLRGLGRFVGEPSFTGGAAPMQNLYFLWSVERAAMLYGLKTIGGKDWYGWGAQSLLRHQSPANGSWDGARYPGSMTQVDTCFALLFLKRSNLTQDLTNNFDFYLYVLDPEMRK